MEYHEVEIVGEVKKKTHVDAIINGGNVEKRDKEKAQEQPSMKACESPIPYPVHVQAKYTKRENQFFKFLEIFMNLHISVPFPYALAEMPN